MDKPPSSNPLFGCHRNHVFLHIPNRFFFENGLISHLEGPNKQFGIHEILSYGGAWHSKIDKTKILIKKGGLIKVESISECSHFINLWV